MPQVVNLKHPCCEHSRLRQHPDSRVREIDTLRVVDSSLIPQVTKADLNAPTMMMAERIADIDRGRALLPLRPSRLQARFAGRRATFEGF